LASFDAWQAAQATEQGDNAVPPSSTALPGSKPRPATASSSADPRRLSAPRTGLLVGTDDGSVHLLSVQGLVLLHSLPHVLEGTVIAMGLLQRVRLEEIIDDTKVEETAADATSPKQAKSRRATMTNEAKEEAAQADVTPQSPLSATAAKLKLLRRASNPLSVSFARRASRGESLDISAAPTPQVTQNFHKRVFFAAVPKQPEPTPAQKKPADNEDDDGADLAAAVAELGEGNDDERAFTGSSPRRRPFSARSVAPYRPAEDRRWRTREPVDDEPEPQTAVEFLARQQAKQAAKSVKSSAPPLATPSSAMTEKVEEAKSQPALLLPSALKVDTEDPNETEVFLTEVQPSSQPMLQVLGAKQYRRVLDTRVFVADSMAESDALLYDVHTVLTDGDESTTGASTSDGQAEGLFSYSKPPSLTQLTWGMQLLKSFFPHARPPPRSLATDDATPPATMIGPDGIPLSSLGRRPATSDATSCDLCVVNDPLVGVHLFVAGSSEGRVTCWTADGEHVGALGQAEQWPLIKPVGSVLEQVREISSSPRWNGGAGFFH